MINSHFPNTNILVGKLNEGHLEKISKAYIECGFNIHGKTICTSVDSINNDNKNLRQFEVTPNPFGEADKKIIFSPKYYSDGNLYVDVKIINDLNLQEKFNKELRNYLVYGKI